MGRENVWPCGVYVGLRVAGTGRGHYVTRMPRASKLVGLVKPWALRAGPSWLSIQSSWLNPRSGWMRYWRGRPSTKACCHRRRPQLGSVWRSPILHQQMGPLPKQRQRPRLRYDRRDVATTPPKQPTNKALQAGGRRATTEPAATTASSVGVDGAGLPIEATRRHLPASGASDGGPGLGGGGSEPDGAPGGGGSDEPCSVPSAWKKHFRLSLDDWFQGVRAVRAGSTT